VTAVEIANAASTVLSNSKYDTGVATLPITRGTRTRFTMIQIAASSVLVCGIQEAVPTAGVWGFWGAATIETASPYRIALSTNEYCTKGQGGFDRRLAYGKTRMD
jgi:hypothetical protein